MSSYVCFLVKEQEKNSKRAIVINCFGRSSHIYEIVSKVCGYCEEEKEFTNKYFLECLSALDNKISENLRTISIYEDCMKNSKDDDVIFDYAKMKQELLEEIERLHDVQNWLKFYFELDCKKYICFD